MAGFSRYTSEQAKSALAGLLQEPLSTDPRTKMIVQVVRAIRFGMPLPAGMRGRVGVFEEALRDPSLRTRVYQVLDRRSRSGKANVERWRGFKIAKGKKPNNGRRRPPTRTFPG